MPEMLNEVVGFLYRSIVSNMSLTGLFFAYLAGMVGSKRGRPFWAGFLLAFVVSWLPAMLIMSVLPPHVGTRRSRSEGLEDARREQQRIAEAERRAQQQPAAPRAPEELPRGKAASGRRAAGEPQSSPPTLPQPAAEPLPSDLHPDPLYDAPRVTLRGEARSTTRPVPRPTEAETSLTVAVEAGTTESGATSQVAAEDEISPDAVADPPRPARRGSKRQEAFSADGSA